MAVNGVKLPFEASRTLLNSTQHKADKPQLKNPALFKDKSYVNGEWVEAKSGKQFEVVGLFIDILLNM